VSNLNPTEGASVQQYEIAVLYHPDLEIDLDKAAQKVAKIVTDNGGKVISEDNWGKRKLAYKIKGHDHAVYVFYTVELAADSVKKIELTLNITDEVVRFLITKPDLKAIAKAEAFRAARAKKQAGRDANRAEKTEKTEE
jgi:small subunit ribosomal protein S6